MRLQDYPRPPDDNGIGIHWSAGYPLAVGSADVRKRWLPELQRMGVKWVKFLHDGGLEFSEILLKAGIMPVVRLYRHAPNSRDIDKATLGEREILAVRELVAVGVRYFEFNNEPELHNEWEGGQAPEDAIDYVARAAVRDMDTILSLGGYPAVPATAIGNRWDLLAKIIEHGGRSLLNGPVWMAIHNYDINHPLDYPYDIVNQQGEEISAEEHNRLGQGAWSGRTWGPRSREFVNQQRRLGVNSGKTIHDDPSCFLAYARFADLCKQHLGRYLPLLATESGPIVGEDDDPRYPTTTPQSHAEKVVEQARIMMGVSERFTAAPPYYFCTAFWLMANAELRGTGWEEHAWYSGRWPGGRLPAVDALAALPKVARPIPMVEGEEQEPEVEEPGRHEDSMIAGVVHGYPHTRVILRSSEFSTQTVTDERGIYRFTNLPAGFYRISIPEAGFVRDGLQTDGQNHLRVDFEDENPPPDDDQGEQPPTTGWKARIEDGGRSPGFGVLRVSVEDKSDLPVQLSASGWSGLVRQTGSKPEYGPCALEFAPLGAGTYTVTPAEIGVSAEVKVDSNRILWVRFVYGGDESEGDTTPDASSVISGQVANGAGYTIVLRGPDIERSQVIGPDETYAFTGLPAGSYSLSILDTPARRAGLIMDGSNTRTANFALEEALPGIGSIRGRVPGGAGLRVSLQGPDDLALTQLVAADESFYFSGLAVGDYIVVVAAPQGEVSEGVTVAAGVEHEIVIELPQEAGAGWRYLIEDGGPGPGYAVVRVQVTGQANLPVRIWTTGWSGMLRFTGEKPEFGEFVCDFAPLGSGLYYVEPEGLDLRAEVPADGTRVVRVIFTQGQQDSQQPVQTPKTIDHYLLVGSLPDDREGYLAALNYVSLFRPVIGISADEATLAQHVTILGNERAISAEVAEALTASGSTVERLYGAELARELQRRLDRGQPF